MALIFADRSILSDFVFKVILLCFISALHFMNCSVAHCEITADFDYIDLPSSISYPYVTSVNTSGDFTFIGKDSEGKEYLYQYYRNNITSIADGLEGHSCHYDSTRILDDGTIIGTVRNEGKCKIFKKSQGGAIDLINIPVLETYDYTTDDFSVNSLGQVAVMGGDKYGYKYIHKIHQDGSVSQIAKWRSEYKTSNIYLRGFSDTGIVIILHLGTSGEKTDYRFINTNDSSFQAFNLPFDVYSLLTTAVSRSGKIWIHGYTEGSPRKFFQGLYDTNANTFDDFDFLSENTSFSLKFIGDNGLLLNYDCGFMLNRTFYGCYVDLIPLEFKQYTYSGSHYMSSNGIIATRCGHLQGHVEQLSICRIRPKLKGNIGAAVINILLGN